MNREQLFPFLANLVTDEKQGINRSTTGGLLCFGLVRLTWRVISMQQ